MALRTRPTQFPQLGSGVQTEQITAASRLVSYLTGFTIQPNKAIVGGNAFAHESGIHQDGVIKNPLTYEIMTPQSVGLAGSQLTIGKLSGRKGLQGKLRELGHDLDGEALEDIYRQAIALADSKKDVTDADLLALVEQRASEVPASVELLGWNVTSSHGGNATGSVSLNVQGRGPRGGRGRQRARRRALLRVDLALQPVFGWHPVLTEYEIKAVSAGEDAQGQVLVRCRRSSDEGPGRAGRRGPRLVDEHHRASLEGYLVAVNKLHGAGDQRRRGRVRRATGRGRALVTTYRIAAIPGDGVGPEVTGAARRVLDCGGRGLSASTSPWSDLAAGGNAIDAYGVAIRPEDVTRAGEGDAILLGAVGGPKWDDPTATVRPEQCLFALRGELKLFANLRPVTVNPACTPRRRSGRSCWPAWTC
jgi:hypothetical protein